MCVMLLFIRTNRTSYNEQKLCYINIYIHVKKRSLGSGFMKRLQYLNLKWIDFL